MEKEEKEVEYPMCEIEKIREALLPLGLIIQAFDATEKFYITVKLERL